jgi:hypothetical protein
MHRKILRANKYLRSCVSGTSRDAPKDSSFQQIFKELCFRYEQMHKELPVECPPFLFDFNQIGMPSNVLLKLPSHKAQLHPMLYSDRQTNRQTW